MEAKCPDFSRAADKVYYNETLSKAPLPYCGQPTPAAIYSVLFGIPLIAHIIQASMYRKWGICWPIVMGALWETVSFALRVPVTLDQFSTNGATVPSQLLLLLAPLWINAFCYVIFGRMVYYFLPGGKIGIFKASKMSVLFVLLDIVAFLVQATGGTMAGNTDDENIAKLGAKIYTIGLGVQQAFICGFVVLIVIFHVKMAKGQGMANRTGWKRLVFPMYVSMALITARVIYRLKEYSVEHGDKELTTHEAYMYVLDATLMVICIAIWNVWHPATVLVGPEADFPPSPPGIFRRWCCCCCAVNRKKGWERKYGRGAEMELGQTKPNPYVAPITPRGTQAPYAQIYDYSNKPNYHNGQHF